MYIVPSDKQGVDAAAALWVRTSEVAGGLDQVLYGTRAALACRALAVYSGCLAWPGLPWDGYDARPDQ